MNMNHLKGERVNTDFPGERAPQFGVVTGGAGPWQVAIRWDDGTTGVLHIEDVIFE